MAALLNRLIASGASYQAGAVIAAALAALMLPFYTRALTPEDYGVAETLLTYLILLSIPLRLGLGEAFVRFWFDDDDPEHRRRVSRQATGTVLVDDDDRRAHRARRSPAPLSELLLDERDATLMALRHPRPLGVHEPRARLRAPARRGAPARVLQRLADQRPADGRADVHARRRSSTPARAAMSPGNYVASTFVLFGLWWMRARAVRASSCAAWAPLLRFGAPTIPADMAVFALNVFDRAYLLQSQGKAAAGVYAVSVKLATAVIIAVRGFQLAWPPLAYSITDDDEARRFYAAVTTWYVVVTGIAVAGMTLLGPLARPAARRAASSTRRTRRCRGSRSAGRATGSSSSSSSSPGRAKVTIHQLPGGARRAWWSNVVLVDRCSSTRSGSPARASRSAASYLAMLAVARACSPGGRSRCRSRPAGSPTRSCSSPGVAVAGELLLPTDGVDGFVLRALVLGAHPARAVAHALPDGGGAGGRGGAAASRAALNASAASRMPSPRSGSQRRGDVARVPARVVAGQDERGDRAQRVGERGEPADRARGGGAVVQAHVEVAVARELDDAALGHAAGRELLVVDGDRAGHVERRASRRRAGAWQKSTSSE